MLQRPCVTGVRPDAVTIHVSAVPSPRITKCSSRGLPNEIVVLRQCPTSVGVPLGGGLGPGSGFGFVVCRSGHLRRGSQRAERGPVACKLFHQRKQRLRPGVAWRVERLPHELDRHDAGERRELFENSRELLRRVRLNRASRDDADGEQPCGSRGTERAAIDRELAFEQKHAALRVVQRGILKGGVHELDDSRAADDRFILLRRRKDIGVTIRLLDSRGRLLDFQIARDGLLTCRRACLPLNRCQHQRHKCGGDDGQ